MSEARTQAKKLVNHYFILALEKSSCKVTSDMRAEINDIVDLIIDAAVKETIAEIRNSQLKGSLE